MGDLENAPHCFVMYVGIGTVTLVLIIPVDDEHRAIRTIPEVQPLRPGVIRDHEVILMYPGISGSLAFKMIDIDPAAINVVHEDTIAVFRWPAVSSEVLRRTVSTTIARLGYPGGPFIAGDLASGSE